MYKNQLQELAQRSCFNLPSYSSTREGPDHAPRFKASVIFNGEIFECPNYCSTLRQAEHGAAEVALNALSSTGPARSLTARVLDETGVYKNLLQETAHRAGLNLPVYTSVRSGPGHLPVFTCTVNIANMNFTGVSAKTKKQAEKNAAIAAWSALKRMSISDSVSQKNKQTYTGEEEDQLVVSRVLSSFKRRDEGKNVRRWDHSRSRKGMIRCYRDNNNSGSSSTSMKSTLFHQMKLMDPLMERSFLNLLPPPSRTISKLLPALSSSSSSLLGDSLSRASLQSNLPLSEVKITSQVNTYNVSSPMEEHQKDEADWLCIKDSNVIKKQPIEKEEIATSSSSYKPKVFPFHDLDKLITSISNQTSQHNDKSHMKTNLFVPPNPMKSPIARPVYTGGFQQRRLAPAVHIRSVIPVCAAPPQPSKTIVKEATSHTVSTAASTTTATDSIGLQARTEVILSIESKLGKLEL